MLHEFSIPTHSLILTLIVTWAQNMWFVAKPEHAFCSLYLLLTYAKYSFCLRAEMDIVRSNIDVLVSYGLGPRAEEDFLLARDTCVALLKLGKIHKVQQRPTHFTLSDHGHYKHFICRNKLYLQSRKTFKSISQQCNSRLDLSFFFYLEARVQCWRAI